MNLERERERFTTMLDADLTIGRNHLIDDLPARFTAPDFLYFFALKDHFWAHVPDEEQRLISSLAMTECYLSALLDVCSGDYRFSEENAYLESCILYGDLLSGAFCEKLIGLDRIDILQRWLVLLQTINKDLLDYAREGRSTRDKHLCLVTHLVTFLSQPEERDEQVAFAQKLLVDHVYGEAPASVAAMLETRLASAGTGVVASAADLRALKKVNP